MDLDLKRLSFLYNALKEKTPKEMASDPVLRKLSAELREIYIQYIRTEKYTVQNLSREIQADEILFVRLLPSVRRAQEIAAEAATQ
jgi:ABC-type bacteriocin/lantibiotic exporter with double-glycine peptidase domain